MQLGARRPVHLSLSIGSLIAVTHFPTSVASSSRLRRWVLFLLAWRWLVSQTLTFGSSTAASYRCSTSFRVATRTASNMHVIVAKISAEKAMQLGRSSSSLSETLRVRRLLWLREQIFCSRTHSLHRAWWPWWGTSSGNTILAPRTADWVLRLQLFFDCFQRTLKQLVLAFSSG